MAGKTIDATLRFVDKFTSPMNAAITSMQRASIKYQTMAEKMRKSGASLSGIGSTMSKGVIAPLSRVGKSAERAAVHFSTSMKKIQSSSLNVRGDMEQLSNQAQIMGNKMQSNAKKSADAFSQMSKSFTKKKGGAPAAVSGNSAKSSNPQLDKIVSTFKNVKSNVDKANSAVESTFSYFDGLKSNIDKVYDSGKKFNKFMSTGTAGSKKFQKAKKTFNDLAANGDTQLAKMKTAIGGVGQKFLDFGELGKRGLTKVHNGIKNIGPNISKLGTLSKNGLGKIKSNIVNLGANFTSFGDLGKAGLAKIGTGIKGIGPMFLNFGSVCKRGLGNAGKSIFRVGPLFKKLGLLAKAGLGLISTPAGAVVASLAGIVVAGILVYKNWNKIKKFASSLGKKIKSVFKQCGGNAKVFSKAFSSVKKNINKIVKNLKTIFGQIIKFLQPVIKFVAGVFVKSVGAGFRVVMGIAVGLGTGIAKVVKGITKALAGITGFVAGIFTGNWKKAWNGVKDIFGGVFDALVGIAKTPFNAVIGLINGVLSGINKINIKVPGWVPGLGGKKLGFNISKIPYLYKGTDNWKGGLAVTQDRGGEIMDLPKGTRVYPHDKSLQMAKQEGVKSAKGKKVTINISKLADKVIVRSEQDIDKIAYEIGKKLATFIENGGGEYA
ncbi:phage tail length tape-measure protein [Lachnospiraceae bacterium KM106-2]|nr:phage tail length tape-measure protein [Lachnospiraceae bacterium KM106-2]